MNRRQFIRNMIVTVTAVCSGATAIGILNPKPPRRPLTNAEKEYIITQALGTPEGKTTMALAMCGFIHGRIGYQEVGKKLLLCT